MPDTINDWIYFIFNAVAFPTVCLLFLVRIQDKLIIKKWIVFAAALPIQIITTYLYSINLVPRIVSFIVFHAILLTVTLCISKDKIMKKIIGYVILVTVILAIDLLSYFVSMAVPEKYNYLFGSTFVMVFLSLILHFSEQFFKGIQKKKLNKKSFIFLLIPVSQVITLLSFGIELLSLFPRHDMLLNQKNVFTGTTVIIICSSALLSLIVDIIAFKQYIKSLDLAQVEAENKSLEYQNELNLNYFNELKENETELRKIKHDIGGCLETMKEIIYTENNTEKAQYFFDELSQALGNITTGFYCQNSLINAIIMSKAKICDKQSIAFNVDLRIPDEINVSDTDLCRILVNMLDNAIEANGKTSGNKFINLSIKEIDGYLYLSTKNPFNGEDICGTSKENKKDHGYGLKILNDFAKKYNGNCQIKTNDNQLSNLLVLQNKR